MHHHDHQSKEKSKDTPLEKKEKFRKSVLDTEQRLTCEGRVEKCPVCYVTARIPKFQSLKSPNMDGWLD